MITLIEEGVHFEFPDGTDAYKFDQQDKNNAHYHEHYSEMKAVDVVAVYPSNELVFIEIKDFWNKKEAKTESPNADDLVNALKYKYRDSFLYLYGHSSLKNNLTYICLLNHIDSKLYLHLQKRLERSIPVGLSGTWNKAILNRLFVVDSNAWNRSLSHYGQVII